MYFESIRVITLKNGYCRAIDIVRHLGFSKPTVSEQLKRLKENGYVEVNEDGHITLTDKAEGIARMIHERHLILTDLFTSIGVNATTAENDACRVEHYLSEETFEALKKLTSELKKEHQ